MQTKFGHPRETRATRPEFSWATWPEDGIPLGMCKGRATQEGCSPRAIHPEMSQNEANM